MDDANFGRTPSCTAVAYTNSDNDPATGTALNGIDPTLAQLMRITTPNGAIVNTVGSLVIGTLSSIAGFDILTVGTSNTAFFAGIVNGSMMSELFTANLDTVAAILIDSIGATTGVQGLALTAIPEPSTFGFMATGLMRLGAASCRRRRAQA